MNNQEELRIKFQNNVNNLIKQSNPEKAIYKAPVGSSSDYATRYLEHGNGDITLLIPTSDGELDQFSVSEVASRILPPPTEYYKQQQKATAGYVTQAKNTVTKAENTIALLESNEDSDEYQYAKRLLEDARKASQEVQDLYTKYRELSYPKDEDEKDALSTDILRAYRDTYQRVFSLHERVKKQIKNTTNKKQKTSYCLRCGGIKKG